MGSKVFTSTYSMSGYVKKTYNVRLTYSETYNSSTNQSTIAITNVELQIEGNTTNWGSLKFVGNVTVNGTTILTIPDSWSYTVTMPGDANYHSVVIPTSSSVTVPHNSTGGGTFTLEITGSSYSGEYYFGAWYDNQPFGAKAQSATVSLTTHSSTLTINPNGGTWNSTSAESRITRAPTETYTIPNPTRTGYTFSGWTKSGGGSLSGTTYTFGDSNGTLTAGWTINSYTLTTAVSPSGYGTISLNPAGASMNYGTSKTLTATPTQITGYTTTFNSWSKTSGTFSQGNTTNPITFTIQASNATVTASFTRTANKYYIVFNGNGATGGSMSAQEFTYDVTQKLTANAFIRNGYEFLGWALNSSSTTIDYTDQQSVSNLAASGNKNLYAVWKRTNFTISYSANGHGTAPTSQTKQWGTDLTLRAFITNAADVDGSTSTYVITGNANGGTWSGSDGSATSQPTYMYTQNAWNTASNGSGTSFPSQGTYTLESDNTLYAQWTESIRTTTYTYILPTGTPTNTETVNIIFNPNGGTTTKSSEYTHRAMVFTGWWTAAVGGVQRTASSQVQASETVYAHYDQGAGTFAQVTLPTAQQCTKTGQTLLGWSYSPYATIPDYEPGEVIYPTTTDPLYAVWDKYGLVYINNEKYQIRIGNGTTWERYRAYIGNGSEWVAY